MTLCGVCILRIIWIFAVVPLSPNIRTLILSYPITWTVTSLAFFLYYLHGGWLKRRMRVNGMIP